MRSGKRNGKPSRGSYFLDSYAAIEIGRRNPDYERFRDCHVVLTKMNIFEIFQACVRDFNAARAYEKMMLFSPFIQSVPLHVIAKGALMRITYIKRHLSMTDCIGYCFAKYLGIPFLTGDKEFEDLENVEYVK